MTKRTGPRPHRPEKQRVLELALAADCCLPTAERALMGFAVRGRVGERIRRVLAAQNSTGT